MNNSKPRTTYSKEVHSFDHRSLAQLHAYQALRQALSDIANEAQGVTLTDFLAAVRDMAVTAPFGDTCPNCKDAYHMNWSHRVDRDGDWLKCTYRCHICKHVWTCGYSVDMPGML